MSFRYYKRYKTEHKKLSKYIYNAFTESWPSSVIDVVLLSLCTSFAPLKNVTFTTQQFLLQRICLSWFWMQTVLRFVANEKREMCRANHFMIEFLKEIVYMTTSTHHKGYEQTYIAFCLFLCELLLTLISHYLYLER